MSPSLAFSQQGLWPHQIFSYPQGPSLRLHAQEQAGRQPHPTPAPGWNISLRLLYLCKAPGAPEGALTQTHPLQAQVQWERVQERDAPRCFRSGTHMVPFSLFIPAHPPLFSMLGWKVTFLRRGNGDIIFSGHLCSLPRALCPSGLWDGSRAGPGGSLSITRQTLGITWTTW